MGDCQICSIFITVDKVGDHCSEGGIISMISSMKILVQTCYKFDFSCRLINGSSDRNIMTRQLV